MIVLFLIAAFGSVIGMIIGFSIFGVELSLQTFLLWGGLMMQYGLGLWHGCSYGRDKERDIRDNRLFDEGDA